MTTFGRYRRYPKEMKYRAAELYSHGLSYQDILDRLEKEYPEPTKHLRSCTGGGRNHIYNWTSTTQKTSNIPGNNTIDPDEDLGIIEHFELTPRPTSDQFNELTQNIPELLRQKREELQRITKQVRQLERMSKILAEDQDNEQQPEMATG